MNKKIYSQSIGTRLNKYTYNREELHTKQIKRVRVIKIVAWYKHQWIQISIYGKCGNKSVHLTSYNNKKGNKSK